MKPTGIATAASSKREDAATRYGTSSALIGPWRPIAVNLWPAANSSIRIVRAAIHSGTCQLAGSERAITPGKTDQIRIVTMAVPAQARANSRLLTVRCLPALYDPVDLADRARYVRRHWLTTS
jgi:hypothetical protein